MTRPARSAGKDDERERCPECGSDDLDGWDREWETGVVADDGSGARETTGGLVLVCRACGLEWVP